jgi:methylenetetrahydrofolate dehydrogenase (NADP+)/methenyltetrahydrofolate cyclohydrolase
MELLDGNKLAKEIRLEIKEKVYQLKLSGKKTPHLAAILVGNDGASQTYVNSKVKACEEVGFNSTLIRLDADIAEQTLISHIHTLNNDIDIDGFIVQLPLPKHINESRVLQSINSNKDVDGFHAINMGKMLQNEDGMLPATPKGILEILERYKIPTEGKHCVVLGRSNIVGLPMSVLMARKGYPGNCTVTLCHSKTVDIKSITKNADIIIAALGSPDFITKDMVKKGVVIIDVGITRVKDLSHPKGYVLKGDVKFDEVAKLCSYITPVPGGVGPMTVASLLLNTLKASSIAHEANAINYI